MGLCRSPSCLTNSSAFDRRWARNECSFSHSTWSLALHRLREGSIRSARISLHSRSDSTAVGRDRGADWHMRSKKGRRKCKLSPVCRLTRKHASEGLDDAVHRTWLNMRSRALPSSQTSSIHGSYCTRVPFCAARSSGGIVPYGRPRRTSRSASSMAGFSGSYGEGRCTADLKLVM